MPKPAAHSSATSRWGIHPLVDYSQSLLANMQQRTGRTFEEWVALTKKQQLGTVKERKDWLKATHGIGSSTGQMIADMVDGNGWDWVNPEAYLQTADRFYAAMFADKKAHLQPIAEALIETVQQLGSDVKVCPCQTIIPVYRTHVFAEIKPATLKRIDLGFAFGNTPPSPKLIDTGGFAKKNRITFRYPLESVDDLTKEVCGWLKEAYSRDTK